MEDFGMAVLKLVKVRSTNQHWHQAGTVRVAHGGHVVTLLEEIERKDGTRLRYVKCRCAQPDCAHPEPFLASVRDELVFMPVNAQ